MHANMVVFWNNTYFKALTHGPVKRNKDSTCKHTNACHKRGCPHGKYAPLSPCLAPVGLTLARKRTTGRKKDQIDLQHRPHFENRKMVLFKCLVWMSSRVNSAKRFTHTRLSELCGRKWTLGRASLLRVLRDWLCEAIYMSGKHTHAHA